MARRTKSRPVGSALLARRSNATTPTTIGIRAACLPANLLPRRQPTSMTLSTSPRPPPLSLGSLEDPNGWGATSSSLRGRPLPQLGSMRRASPSTPHRASSSASCCRPPHRGSRTSSSSVTLCSLSSPRRSPPPCRHTPSDRGSGSPASSSLTWSPAIPSTREPNRPGRCSRWRRRLEPDRSTTALATLNFPTARGHGWMAGHRASLRRSTVLLYSTGSPSSTGRCACRWATRPRRTWLPISSQRSPTTVAQHASLPQLAQAKRGCSPSEPGTSFSSGASPLRPSR